MPTTFDVPFGKGAITVTVDDGVEVTDKGQLTEFPAFKNWLNNLDNNLAIQEGEHRFGEDPWVLNKVRIRDVTMFGPRIGFMTIEAFLNNREGNRPLERVVFLRGGSVAILMILRPKDNRNERYVIMTEQPRIGACSTSFLEIPAGMLDEKSENVKWKATEEIAEETGLQVKVAELIDMTALALQEATTKEKLQPAMYPSPANLDEYIPLLLWEKELDRKEIEAFKGKLTGKRSEDELITLRVHEYDILWKEGARDVKTLAAWALYEGLNRAGKIEERLRKIRQGRPTK